MEASGELERRVARNEAAFREINERIGAAHDSPDARRVGFLCECGRASCRRIVELTSAEYQAVRAGDRQFAVLPGHEIIAAEDVVKRHPRYLVVRKRAPVPDETGPAEPAA